MEILKKILKYIELPYPIVRFGSLVLVLFVSWQVFSIPTDKPELLVPENQGIFLLAFLSIIFTFLHGIGVTKNIFLKIIASPIINWFILFSFLIYFK